jgi:hypothetical protein
VIFTILLRKLSSVIAVLGMGQKRQSIAVDFNERAIAPTKNLEKPLVRPKWMRKFTRLFMFEPIKAELDGAAEKLGRLRRFL